MDIGIPRAWSPEERRVALTPAGVRALAAGGHAVYVERGAGLGAGFDDQAYEEAGAQIAYDHEEVYARAELLVTVDGVAPDALGALRGGQVVCGFLHLNIAPTRTIEALADSGARTLSYELIRRDDGALPVLLPMSEICGRLLPQIAAHLLETRSGGRGILLTPVPGVPSAEVVIIGAGKVGGNAAYGFSAVSVQTTVLDHDLDRLRRVEQICLGRITTRLCTESALAQVLPFADVLIGAVHVPGVRAPKLISAEMVSTMKPRSAIIDVAINQGGCVATSRPTTHRDPTYTELGVLHYAVPNIPSAVARTASHALNNALLPYIQSVAALGVEVAAGCDPALARGVSALRARVFGDGG